MVIPLISGRGGINSVPVFMLMTLFQSGNFYEAVQENNNNNNNDSGCGVEIGTCAAIKFE